MPTVYDLKPKFQALLRPLLLGLRKAGLTPNGLTLLALAGSFAVGTVLPRAESQPRLLLLLPVWLFLRMALNALDGMMAREMNMQSRTGAVLNEVSDVLSDLALYLPLGLLAAPVPVILFALGAMATEFCGVLSQALGAGRQYQGPMGKSDRAFVVGALALATALRPRLATYWPWVFGIAAVLTVLTCFNRLRPALTPDGAKGGEA